MTFYRTPSFIVTAFITAAVGIASVQTCTAGDSHSASDRKPQVRELHIVLEFDAKRSWVYETEERGRQHSSGTTHQIYEIRTRLRSDGIHYKRNLLDLDQEKRLKAKTLHYARQALLELKEAGHSVQLPTTGQARSQLALQMKEEKAACGADVKCRANINTRYAKLFAAAQYPDLLKKDPGGGHYAYYEPYSGCPVYTRVQMDTQIEGVEYSDAQDELVKFKEQRTVDTENVETELPLCQRYVSVIDTADDSTPFYLENFYMPSAIGKTTRIVSGKSRSEFEPQPQIPSILSWVNEQLRHAAASGSAEATIRLTDPLNGISRRGGHYPTSKAHVKLTWSFDKVQEAAQGAKAFD